jgi:glyoxylase-like metal-dependent hydrolase (beta-lactamase superfamily II)
MADYRLVNENVYQIGGSEISDPADCSIYLVKVNSDECILIDSGAGNSFDALLKNIQSIGLDPDGLKALILTHCHIDHIGSASNFKERFGCKVIAHKLDAEAIEGRDLTPTAAEWYNVKYKPVMLDMIITDESKIIQFGDITFYCLHTPGHTPGSISVYCDIVHTRVLFGQDIHGPFDPSFGSNIEHWKASMQKLLDLDADILCEGHFGVYRPKEHVKRYIEGYLSKY